MAIAIHDAGSEVRKRRLLWGLLIGSHLTAVLCSRGYFHPDEHFQVLAFVQWKLGLVPDKAMPWELAARMRPWLHPLLFFPLEWLSFHVLDLSPFTRTALHRACAATLALLVIHRLQRGRDLRLLLLYATLFFFPLLDVRISSEVIAGWLLALAYALDAGEGGDFEPKAARAFGVGLLLGLCGVIRLQLWAMVGGLLLFHLVRRNGRRVVWQAAGIAVAIAAGTLADRWGYGEFVFVPWNYVHQNLVLGKAAQWGVAPAHAYVPMLLEASGYLPGAVLIGALLWQWLKRPFTKLSWMTVPFVLLHMAIGHKELRFLFSLAPFMPLLLLSLWNDLGQAAWLRRAGIAFVALNVLLLVPASVLDPMPQVGLYAALRAEPGDPTERLHFIGRSRPLHPAGLHEGYYLGPHQRRERRVRPTKRPPPGLLAAAFLRDYERLRDRGRCRLIASRYPNRVVGVLRELLPRKAGNKLEMWSLWRCP